MLSDVFVAMSKKRFLQKRNQKNIARERICYLFQLAEDELKQNNIERTQRYISLARKISMRYLVPIPVEYKHRFCKNCYMLLQPGSTSRIRIHRGHIVTYCMNCHHFIRSPYGKKASNTLK